MSHENTSLVLKDVNKSFAKVENDTVVQALDDINLSVGSQEFVSIVGPSGCGKSTILRLVAGLIGPTEGHISVNGKEVTGPDPNRGMVFQNPTLFPWLTVEDNIGFSLEMQGTKEHHDQRIGKMLEMIGLRAFSQDYPGQLSGGMAQRVALARSLINEPDILLMDEPLGALDAFTRMNIQDEILRIWGANKQLVMMVTHDVDEAIYMSTRVIVMNANPGRITHDIEIKLPYPRDRSSDEFVTYRKDILNKLHFGGNTMNDL